MLAGGTIESFREQARWCDRLGSPLYAELLARAADDVARGGLLAGIVDGWQGRPMADALPLRLFGGVHRLVLAGEAPELARHYPSAGGHPRWPDCWAAFLRVVETRRAEVCAALHRQVQTNEVQRSGLLLGGFLAVAHRTGLPLRLLEIGSSAGLNLLWDQYRYAFVAAPPEMPADPNAPVAHRWGDPRAVVAIRIAWHGAGGILARSATVASRAGCDLAPVDVHDDGAVRGLESFVWADQPHRLAQLRAAVWAARTHPLEIRRQSAADWIAVQLEAGVPDIATLVFHSIMWMYLSDDERRRVTALLERAGARASPRAPLAWLRCEFVATAVCDLRLTVWPTGEERTLAIVDPHGRWVRWTAGED
ncbi:MAG: DUF2332 domain-containing protein [Candidatus Binatia bacterium]